MKKNKVNIEENLETLTAAELAARAAQEHLDSESVQGAIRTYHGSIAKRMMSLFAAGKPSGLRDAVDDLGKTRKGFSFEALLGSRHLGASPLNRADYGIKGSTIISPTDTQVDVKTVSRGFFGNQDVTELAQAKSSVAEALKAINGTNYKNPIVVPKDVYDELLKTKKPQVDEAVRLGRLRFQQGDSGPIDSHDVFHRTRKALHRVADGSAQDNFYKEVAIEVGRAATVGAVVRGGFAALRILATNKKIERKHLKELAIEAGKGGTQTAIRVGLARGIEHGLVSKGFVAHGGRWLGRTAGAAAGLVVSTVVDGFGVAAGKINPGDFGLNFSKNLTVAVCTAVSGPLGLGVSLGITATDMVYRARIENHATAKAAFDALACHEQKISAHLMDMRSDVAKTKSYINEQKKVADETLALIKRRGA